MVQVDKEQVLVKLLLSSLYSVTYKGVESLITPENHGHKITWSVKSGTITKAIAAKVGKAIEKHVS